MAVAPDKFFLELALNSMRHKLCGQKISNHVAKSAKPDYIIPALLPAVGHKVVSQKPIFITGNHVTKDELRAELERQAQRYKDVYGGEVVTYAAQPDPERKPWRKRPSLLDQAFQHELEKIEQARQAD